MKWEENVSRIEERAGAFSILMGKPEGRRPLGRPRHGRNNNIETGLKEVGLGMDWIDLAQDWDRWRDLVNAVRNIWFP
jgi:hypothetical protein